MDSTDGCVKVRQPRRLFGLPFGTLIVKMQCTTCGFEDWVQVVISAEPDTPEEQPEDHQIKRLVNAAYVLGSLGLLSIVSAPLYFWLIEKYLLHLSVPSLGAFLLDVDTVRGCFSWSFLVFGLFYLCTVWPRRRASRLQAQRNFRMARTEHRPPILVLRSFLNTHLVHNARTQLHPAIQYGGENIIKTVESALSAFGRPVALGIPKHERPDSGQQQIVYVGTSDETWQQVMIIFAALSRFVLMIPGWTDGVVNEMEILGSTTVHYKGQDVGLLSSRTIVLMPHSRGTTDRKRIASEWNRVKERSAAFGFRIPSYDDRGMLYIPNPDFSIRTRVLLPPTYLVPSHMGAIVLGIQKLLPMIAAKYGRFADALRSAGETCGIKLCEDDWGCTPQKGWGLENLRTKIFASPLSRAGRHFIGRFCRRPPSPGTRDSDRNPNGP